MLGRVLTHAVLFCLGLRIFLHAVHFGIGDHARNRNPMTDMIAELEAVALDLPSAAFRSCKLVLIGVVALLKAARERSCFLMGGLCCVLRRSQSGSTRKHEQRKKCHRDLDFHPLPPKFRIDKRKSRPGTWLFDYDYLRIGGLVCYSSCLALLARGHASGYEVEGLCNFEHFPSVVPPRLQFSQNFLRYFGKQYVSLGFLAIRRQWRANSW